MKKFIKRYWLIIISVLYLIWPIDLIADIFGPIGLIDDAALILTVIVRELVLHYKNKRNKSD